MDNQVFWMLSVNINDGEIENFNSLMAEMVAATEAKEPEALNYEWFIKESTCQIYERYSDSAATMVHLGNFGANYAERFMGMVVPTGLTIYGSPSDEVKEAMAAFSPAYMPFSAGFNR